MDLVKRLRKFGDDLSRERFTVRETSLEAADEIESLRAALAKLVALKAMKDEMSHMLLREEGGMGLDYDRRKPLAWQRARELVGSNVELTGAARLYRSASSDRRERG